MSTENTVTAVVGLGGIGGGIAHRLLATGHDVVVYNRTRSKAVPLVEAGARAADSPADAAAEADVVVVSLSDEEAVEKVVFGEMASRLRPGTTLIEMSTLSAEYARAAAERLAALGVHRVEACVIGNPAMAKAGDLRVFAAGRDEDVERVRPLLGSLGRQGMLHLGETGRATALKLAFNALLGVMTAGLAEAVVLAEQAGIPRETLLTAIQKSGWRSPVLNFRAEFMRTRAYQPAGFRARLMAKDLRLAAEASDGARLPLIELTSRRFAEVVAADDGDKDAAVIVELGSGEGGR
ncbi:MULTISPECIES: NAD(P)-dependent oxidoreductase [Thermomonospora]|uniref:3-hydroxyisobutyrate dehydrogenase n=1 Tax=Thermomonospora cellulosilytica TaxID=1411118 RepID=A0A7W3N122_9ACTN|nr:MULTISPECIES: NAD(P)-dependent oxidoreductase [Thermomonospora]MBA9005512.1 3-hydroxyisobutyrate dehydrogenase [Thermomonospora cellulosilytica]